MLSEAYIHPSLEPVDGEKLDHPRDQNPPRHDLVESEKHLGAAVIGIRQWRLNQKYLHKNASHQGPATALTAYPGAYDAWQAAGSPKDWQEWLEGYLHAKTHQKADKPKAKPTDRVAETT